MDRHIHQAELGVVLHLLLTVEGHSGVGLHAGGADKVAGLDEHAAAAAGGVQQHTALRFQDIDDHLDQGFGGEEHPIVLGDILGKFVEEIFIDAADHVAAHLVQGAVVENAQQLRQKLVRENGVILGQNARQLLRLGLHQFHGVVDHLTQAVHGVAALVGQFRRGDVGGEVDQIFILRLPGQKQGAFGNEVAGLHRQNPAAADRTVFQNFLLHQLEAAVCVAQKNQAQHRHTVLIGGQLGSSPEQISGLPQVRFQFSDVYHKTVPPRLLGAAIKQLPVLTFIIYVRGNICNPFRGLFHCLLVRNI